MLRKLQVTPGGLLHLGEAHHRAQRPRIGQLEGNRSNVSWGDAVCSLRGRRPRLRRRPQGAQCRSTIPTGCACALQVESRSAKRAAVLAHGRAGARAVCRRRRCRRRVSAFGLPAGLACWTATPLAMHTFMLLLYAAGLCGRAGTCCPTAWRWSCCTCPPLAACPARAPRCCLCTARTTGPGAGRCVSALLAQRKSGRGSMVHRLLRCLFGMSVCHSAAPCLQERWMPYFAAAGYDCCAFLAASPWIYDSDALSACDAMLRVNHLQAGALLEAHLQAACVHSCFLLPSPPAVWLQTR